MTMAQEQLRHHIYERYKLVWMLEHGHTLREYVGELKDYSNDLNDGGGAEAITPLNDVAVAWEYDSGFGNHECWVCYREFVDNEYRNVKYVEHLLKGDPDRAKVEPAYLEDVKEE